MLEYFKRLLPHELRQHLKRALFAHQDMTTRLANLRRAGFSPTGAVDGGAYRGDWTRILWNLWPHCPSVMIEPLVAQQGILTSLAERTRGSVVVAEAIGNESGEVSFRLAESNSSIVRAASSDELIRVSCTTLDIILDDLCDYTPNLLKLDLQGFELEALAGCERHLRQFEVVILEVSLLRIGDVPIFSEVDQFMELRGYRLYDVLTQYYRPHDGALWQVDAFYVRQNSALIANRSWK